MLGALKSNRFRLTDEPKEAETIIVNTCGFIDSAKQESIDTLLELANYRKNGRLNCLVMAGCLAQRYSKDLELSMPEVDLFIGTGEYHRVAELLKERTLGQLRKKRFVDIPKYIHTEETPRLNTGHTHTAFLKISEGCMRKCSFCIIPQLRGTTVRSRNVQSLVTEAERLVSGGVKEICLVAQDLTHFGVDTDFQENLPSLLRSLVKVPGLEWIRLHYAYPDNFSDELIEIIASEPKVLNYLDMPLQYGDDKVLKLMNRAIRVPKIYQLIEKLRNAIPNLVFRTNMIVGHPGETQEAFENMRRMVTDLQFDHLGVFQFSLEEGTPSFKLALKIGTVPEEVILNRHNEIMELQQSIVLAKNEARVGKRLEVLVDGVSSETDLLLQGRHYGQAAEVDGVVFINDGTAKAGDLVTVEITEAMPYDLVGGIVADGTA